ncbi:MAG: cyclic nucleotide-binding domain-containing protein [Chloroflexi bacterium]|nr:cyclic nucleotide-binding domain-containing protein [Chloroflexota bacterium]
MEGIWAALAQRLDFASFVPKPVDGIERADLRTRNGSPYTVLKDPHGDGGAGTYVRLDEGYVELFELMDGTRTTSGILVEHLQRRGFLALDRLAMLTANLAANGFFGDATVDVYARLRRRRALRDPLVRLSLFLRRLIVWNVATWKNAESTIDVLYRFGGRLAFTRLGAVILVLASLAGIVLWAREFGSARHDMFRVGGSVAWGVIALALLQVAQISVHELGHALAIRHFGRRVRLLGLAVYYLFPCAYVDATDMIMAPRWQRVIVALAGPLAGAIVAFLAMIVALTSTDPIVAGIAFSAATIFIFQLVLNLLPILDLDGYHILVDVLDAPLLRQRALAFARARLPVKIRRRERWSATEILLAAYGVLALFASIATLAFAALVWNSRIAPLAAELTATGLVGAVVLGVILVAFVGPILVQLAIRGAGWARTALGALRSRRGRDAQAILLERVRVLGRVRFLSNLTPQALAALADHIREEHVERGQVVVTHGEEADRFFIVRSGLLETVAPDGQTLGRVIPGEGFGELALLDGTPRTATVRAIEPTVLWSIDRGHFGRWIKDRFEVAARIRASEEERARLGKVPFFRALGSAELRRLSAKLVIRRVPAGEFVVRAGEPGDRYYVIREGTAEVIGPDDRPIRTLGPDQDFGELALLFGGGRTASVRAVTDLVLMSLARNDFAALVKASGETLGGFRTRTSHYENAPGLGSAVSTTR